MLKRSVLVAIMDFGKIDFYRVVRYGRWLWVIIEPKRGLFLRTEDNKLLTFKNKADALYHCEKMGYKVGDEYT